MPRPGSPKPLNPRQRRKVMKKVALSKVKDDLSKYLRMAEKEQVIITRHGKPAGVLIGIADEEDRFDSCLDYVPRLLKNIASARKSLRAGRCSRTRGSVSRHQSNKP